ncbi:hypothetical protein [Telmatospirillum sp. J64-1]|uniref:hypothetical protein n=1 Tax=Telmatospirillum sp. J64-1 TaxID=2502183 RepID=UPI00163D4E2A|nr:hypothetical protein [Telmatospirillum sp. J64-1]
MTDAPDIRALAQRYLDLWQDQMTALAADPALADAMAKTLGLMGQSAALAAARGAGMGVPRAAKTPEDKERSTAAGTGGAKPEAGAPPAAAASAGPDRDPDELARRVAELEQRVARLEAALGRRGRSPGRKPAGDRA